MRPSLYLRPLPWLALVLALGSSAGILAAGGVAIAAVLALAPCALVLRGGRSARPLLALVPLAFVRGWLDAPPLPAGTPTPSELAAARELPVVGRWRSEARAGAGFVEPCGSPAHAGNRILFETGASVPREGDWVALLPARPPSPWPRGPVPGPRASGGRFAGVARVNPDELLWLPGARLGAGFLARAERWIEGVRATIRERTDALESAGRAHGLARSLVLGDRSALADEVRDLFTRTGTAHLLAVSGFNVSLLFGALGLVSLLPAPGDARMRRALLAWILALLLFAYAWIVGGNAPVLRASTTLALSTFALALPDRVGAGPPRRADPLSLWSAALVVECLVSPRELGTVSLQLSYLATLGILLLTRPLARNLAFERLLPEPLVAQAPALELLRILARRALALASLSLAASCAATLATLPVVWARFGEVAPAGVIVTPLVAPLLAWILILAWLGVLFPFLGLGAPIGFLAERFCGLLALADQFPGTPVPLPLRPIPLVALGVGLLALALWREEGVRGPGRAAALVWGLLLLPWTAAPAGLELHALDVGHGSAFVLRAPGLPALLFDAGSRNRREVYEEALAPLLASCEVARPWVVLSHEDADHCSALPRLVERYPPSAWIGALPAHLGERIPHDARRIDVEDGGLDLELSGTGAPLALRLLRAGGEPGNEGSRNLVVDWGAERLLLLGDCEGQGIALLLQEGWIRGPVRLLVLPHHGSESPLLGDLLAAARPETTWISNGEPAPAERELARRGLAFARTGELGPLALTLPWPAPRAAVEPRPRRDR